MNKKEKSSDLARQPHSEEASSRHTTKFKQKMRMIALVSKMGSRGKEKLSLS